MIELKISNKVNTRGNQYKLYQNQSRLDIGKQSGSGMEQFARPMW